MAQNRQNGSPPMGTQEPPRFRKLAPKEPYAYRGYFLWPGENPPKGPKIGGPWPRSRVSENPIFGHFWPFLGFLGVFGGLKKGSFLGVFGDTFLHLKNASEGKRVFMTSFSINQSIKHVFIEIVFNQ